MTPPKLNCCSVPWNPQGTGSTAPTDTQVCGCSSPYIKNCRTKHTFDLSHMQIPDCGSKILFSICSCLNSQIRNRGIWRADCIFIENNPCVSGPTQLKLVLFKDQLYSWSRGVSSFWGELGYTVALDLFFLPCGGIWQVNV